MVGERGSPRIERVPSARGPNSMRPCIQPTALPSASACAGGSRSGRRRAASRTCAPAASSVVSIVVLARSAARDRRRCMPSACAVAHRAARPQTCDSRRAPRPPPRRRRRPPAESRCSSKMPSRRILPLATQLSATPPARHRSALPGLGAHRACEPQHHLLGHRLDGGGDVHVELREQLRFGIAHRLAEQRENVPLVIVRPVQ